MEWPGRAGTQTRGGGPAQVPAPGPGGEDSSPRTDAGEESEKAARGHNLHFLSNTVLTLILRERKAGASDSSVLPTTLRPSPAPALHPPLGSTNPAPLSQ